MLDGVHLQLDPIQIQLIFYLWQMINQMHSIQNSMLERKKKKKTIIIGT